MVNDESVAAFHADHCKHSHTDQCAWEYEEHDPLQYGWTAHEQWAAKYAAWLTKRGQVSNDVSGDTAGHDLSL